MASDLLITVVAYGHILSAVSWLGAGMLTAFAIGPNLRKLAPAAALEFNAKILPKLVRFIEVAVGTTFLFGLLLLYLFKDGDFSFLTSSTQGYVLSAGILVALLTAVLGFALTIPAFRKIVRFSTEAIEKGQPPSPEMMKYGKRARIGSMAGVLMLLFVLAMMVTSGFMY